MLDGVVKGGGVGCEKQRRNEMEKKKKNQTGGSADTKTTVS